MDPRDIREIIAVWIESLPAQTGLTFNAIAERANLTPGTISRAAGRDPKYGNTPSLTTIMKIITALDVPPPVVPGLSDRALVGSGPDVERVGPVGAQPDPGPTEWIVCGRSLLLSGYVPGDHLLVDPSIAPVSGDAVIAVVDNIRRMRSEFVLRIFVPPFIVGNTSGETIISPAVVGINNTTLHGVVVKQWRERQDATVRAG